MPRHAPSMGRKEEKELTCMTQEQAQKKYFHGNPNPSSRDWMLRLSENQTGPEGETTVTPELLAEVLDGCEAYIFQLEEGKSNGYRHYQCFARWASATRFSTIRKRFTDRGLTCSYIAPRRHSVLSCVTYCSKAETRVGETIQHGDFSDVADLEKATTTYADCVEQLESGRTVQELLTDPTFKEIASLKVSNLKALESASLYAQAQEPREVRAFYLWGPPRTGKTYSVQNLRHKPSECYLYDPNNKNPWDDYAGQSCLIIDEFQAQPDFHSLCTWLENAPVTLPARYAPKYALWNEVWIVSNASLAEATALYARKGVPASMLPSLEGRICTEIHRTLEGEKASVPLEYAKLSENLSAIKAIPLAPIG